MRSLIILGGIVSAIFYASAAFACPVLEHAEPKVGSEVTHAPEHVSVTFSSKIFPASSTLEVKDVHGTVVSTGRAYGDAENDTIITTALKPLLPGVYSVHWKVLCDCGDLTPGHYKFTVENPTGV